ncbi:polyamine aminopropyltransferase [Candidatus Desantisbacteria bacterium CG_4_10_14_0_8_um_filter_48_22]|uniref:Polyamine aminopropyltransferase n=1 Tax=Candidatus Desantisbacteria bacterium CG_4_10_14_0_8_um_filter_48_22 TaxID=1974543 RepID=A0A2M7SBY2_9BACT|nr:MAG: hypothetical protein AUJ67_10555 [Candidatus Desantisbacteria bacterium CG1_02_49_89]PIV56023.1 MAG: polyamine aminopropyltransferase [Candidatus Desantisbacteria bacterium CG02_land_8_20_14_3_00_49_13]PIZ16979.1 MAG: polyamine aminopropyltransferase [Candidatus Desantisbacteria bacterium CG_4_10_14_0_8_um_filter_48_22]
MNKKGQKDPNWYIEFLNPAEAHMYGIKGLVGKYKSEYQDILILDTFPYGRCLFLDGKIQSAQLDEFIYHEALVHPALLSHPAPRNVFVGGTGEGASLREILKHPCVKKIIAVDIDKKVIDIAKRHLFQWHRGAFVSPKVRLYFRDARKFLKETKETFDCIILDLCDPGDAQGPAALLFTSEFYKIVSRKLAPGGILTVQCGSTNLNMLKGFAHVFRTLRSVFRNVLPYQADVPSFVGPWGYCMASSTDIPLRQSESARKRIKERKLEGKLRFYNPEIHEAMFVLPGYLKEHFKKGRIIYDKKPF